MKTIARLEPLYAPLFLIAVGLLAVWLSFDYGIGNALEPGAGYFPLILGLLLIGLSVAVAIRAAAQVRRAEGFGGWPVRQLFVIIAALVVFAVLIGGLPFGSFRGAGLIPATFFLVLIAGRATPNFSFRGGLVLAALLSLVAWLVFVKALGLVVPLWPWSY